MNISVRFFLTFNFHLPTLWTRKQEKARPRQENELREKYVLRMVFSDGSVIKNLPATVGDTGLIPGSGRSPGEGNGNPLQYYCLENPMDGGDSPWGRKESDTTE